MTEKFSLEQIREYWTRQALQHRQSPAASWSDRMAVELEIREISKRLADGDRVLDVGCANGYSTIQFATKKRIRIRGLDFVPEMIEQARLQLSEMSDKLLGTVEFDVGDVTALDREQNRTYDKVVATRVIINLGEWSRQLKGLRECARVLKSDGIFLLPESHLAGVASIEQFSIGMGVARHSYAAIQSVPGSGTRN